MDPVNDGLRGRLSLNQRRPHLHPTKVQIATHRALRHFEVCADLGQREPRLIHLCSTHRLLGREALTTQLGPGRTEMLHDCTAVQAVVLADRSNGLT